LHHHRRPGFRRVGALRGEHDDRAACYFQPR
jgi:hypothetical protein